MYKDSDVRDYMDEGGVTAFKIWAISHKEVTNTSFKVVIKQNDLDIGRNRCPW